MERLTARRKDGSAYFPECFMEPCAGLDCTFDGCLFIRQVCERLAMYEERETPRRRRVSWKCGECLEYDDDYCDRFGRYVSEDHTCTSFIARERTGIAK